MKYIGRWWSDDSIEIYEIEGRRIALNGWNGEIYTECFEVGDDLHQLVDNREFEVRPIYRFEIESIDLNCLEENSEEWNQAVEVVDFEVI